MRNTELIDAARHWFELFDRVMSSDNVPIPARPLRSAMWFVRDGIAEVSHGSKENYLDEEWFGAIVSAVEEWYEERYGASAFSSTTESISGLVVFHGNPLRIQMPVTTSRVEVEGESAWLTFPSCLLEDEDPLELFLSRPNLDSLSPDDRNLFLADIKEIVHWSRSTHLNLQMETSTNAVGTQMAVGVWGHIEKALRDILTLKEASAAVGCWELHLSIEKAFKIFLLQNEKKMIGHSLRALDAEARKYGLTVTPSLVAAMPHWQQATSYRYGEQTVPIDRAVDVYRIALQAVFEITQAFKRAISFTNASFLLKKPKWVGYGKLTG